MERLMSYLRNVWYMAAREQEIEGDALLERRLLDRPYHGLAAIQPPWEPRRRARLSGI